MSKNAPTVQLQCESAASPDLPWPTTLSARSPPVEISPPYGRPSTQTDYDIYHRRRGVGKDYDRSMPCPKQLR
eukprot:507975-Alexandrium_andersonii.AAC.1